MYLSSPYPNTVQGIIAFTTALKLAATAVPLPRVMERPSKKARIEDRPQFSQVTSVNELSRQLTGFKAHIGTISDEVQRLAAVMGVEPGPSTLTTLDGICTAIKLVRDQLNDFTDV